MTTPKVVPSGAALAIASTPIRLLAPGLLSTSTGCPSFVCSPTCTSRAIWSVKPPGVYGTITRIGLVGHAVCAKDGKARLAAAVASVKRRRDSVAWDMAAKTLSLRRFGNGPGHSRSANRPSGQGLPGTANGSLMSNRAPPPLSFAASIRPPCACTTACESASPRPRPGVFSSERAVAPR